MAEKRKRPIEPTAKPGEEAVEIETGIAPRPKGGGRRRQVELEGEEIELRQAAPPQPIAGAEGGPDILEEEFPPNLKILNQQYLETDEEFNQAVEALDPERQRNSIMKRKRAA